MADDGYLLAEVLKSAFALTVSPTTDIDVGDSDPTPTAQLLLHQCGRAFGVVPDG